MNAKAFIREVYLRSVPSVDLDKVDGQIEPGDHKLKMSEYDRILEEFGVENGTDLMLSCNMFMLNQGPQLVNG